MLQNNLLKRIALSMCIFLSILAFTNVFAQADPSSATFYKIVSQSNSGIEIEFDFQQLDITSLDERSGISSFEIKGMNLNYVEDLPLLPMLTLPLTLPDAGIDVRLSIVEAETYPNVFPPVFQETRFHPERKPVSDETLKQTPAQVLKPFKTLFPEQIYDLEEAGIFRDYHLSSLRVFPVQVIPGGVKFYKKLRLSINYKNLKMPSASVPSSESSLLKRLVANTEQVHMAKKAVSAMPPPALDKHLTQDAPFRWKVYVDTSALYQITGRDLELAGADLSTIDVNTLALTNRSNEIAFYLVDGKDDVFDPEDYIEFWGERNENTFLEDFPDQFSDPFSDENVYWLSWGGTPTIQMIEENGSLVTNRPGSFNPAFFYNNTIHVEENESFERLGEGNEDQLSYRRDLWYFDSGVKAVGKKEYNFFLPYPDETSFNPVYVEAMFSGKSFDQFDQDFNRIPHDVMVWLNNGFVGSGDPTWIDQDTSRIHNRENSTLRNADLQHGDNVLEVQMPRVPIITLPNSQVQVQGNDIVLLNWFRVTYDRLYTAHKNQIIFRRPGFVPYTNTDLFQFEIDNFSRSDISIYKKDISRIVNFKIERLGEGEDEQFVATFQDNVQSDNIEFIALTNNQKRKPVRIIEDLPFDQENPLRRLRDRSNNAEAVILTHSRFIEVSEELLEYRRSQGWAIELIDIQDIYDEFNAGIKSPIAIQDFLRYAFFNWQRTNRLKYVLLMGDSNFDYKTRSQTNLDFVPTFFIQTREFGASATDYPYSLIAGDDEVPDLFVGRLPVTSNADVNNVVNKIIEYESVGNADAWRNRALFISGNDRVTFELDNFLGDVNPAFRSQNSRVIESLLPNHITSLRLHTIRDETVDFDPNFGGSATLLDAWNDGLFLINFMGHGGGGIWADVQLMDLPDVDRLSNEGMYPFVTSMTCFTGAFENPQDLGLAQKLVLAPRKGAIGVLASSGLGYLHNDYSMLWNVGQYLFSAGMPMGDVTTLGKILYWVSGRRNYNVNGQIFGIPGYDGVRHEMVYQYNLIGDPLLEIKFAQSDLAVSVDNDTPQPGDTLQISIEAGFQTTDGYLELVDQNFTTVESFPISVSQSNNISLIIPSDFPEGTGYVRAYQTNGTVDAAGEVSIGVNFAALRDLTITPERPDVDDSVRVGIRATDAAGITDVYIFIENNLADTLRADQNPLDTDLYEVTLPPTFALRTVAFNVHVENSVGNTSVFRNKTYNVTDIRPDIAFVDNSLLFVGRETTQLKVSLNNAGGAGSDNSVQVRVDFFDGEANFQANQPFASENTTLTSSDSTSVVAPFPLAARNEFQLFVRTTVDEAEDVVDFNPANNVFADTVALNVFNIDQLAGSDTIDVQGIFKVHFPGRALSENSAVRIGIEPFEAPQDQSALVPLPVIRDGQFHMLRVDVLNPDARFQSEFTLSIVPDEDLVDPGEYEYERLKIYRKASARDPWISADAAFDQSERIVTAEPAISAGYALFVSDDFRAPQIELTADGRPLEDTGLVSENPSLYLLVQDESGVNLDRETIEITLNGAELPESQVFIPDSIQANNLLGITVNPELQLGTHQLRLSVQDVSGNRSSKEFDLVVSDGFDIRVYGNYPNPFVSETIFAYFVELNDDLDDFEIRIYTVSGRLIRTIDSDINNPANALDGGARRKGYNELIWDGTDEDGVEVANGLYFALIYAEYDDQVIEKTLKVAKLR